MARKLCRLYLKNLSPTASPVLLEKDQVHYLGTVMRLKEQESLLVFSENAGEWRARLSHLGRQQGALILEEQKRPPAQKDFLGLAFCPLRSNRLSFLVEKATELGVSDFFPLLTERTQQKLPALERLNALAIQASEQCERLTVPLFHPAFKLPAFIENLNQKKLDVNVTAILCDERRHAPSLSLERAKTYSNPLFIVGPEGGFSETEFALITNLSGIHSVTLGRNILRSETAALAALAHFHSST